jgi:radical SAM superfamily enzyme YgiQ (UPF0313 family)
VKPLIVDALAHGEGKRKATLDVIGAGPRTLAGILEEFHVKPKIVTADKFRLTKHKDRDILMVSGMTSDITTVRRVIKTWRKASDNQIIIGGPLASEPIRSIKKTGANIGIVGEGEKTLRELLENGLKEGVLPSNDELRNIRGIVFKDKKDIIFTGFKPTISKLEFNKIKPSTKSIKCYPLYYAARVFVEVVRGCSNYYRTRLGPLGETCVNCSNCFEGGLYERYDCPSHIPPGCGYCSVPSIYGPPKSKLVESIRKEVEELIDEGVHRIVLSAPGFLDYGRDLLVDPEPLTNPRKPEPNYEEIEELLSKLNSIDEISSGNVSLMIENIKATLVTQRSANILGKYLAGTSVNIGFETGSETHCKQLGRPDTPKEVFKAIERLVNTGVKPYVYFIHGLPGQSKKTAEATVKAIEKSMQLGSERVILYRFSSLPMSAFMSCPSGAPINRDPVSKVIYEAANEANRKSKKALIDKKISVIVAEKYNKNQKYLVAYPMKHGPVMLLEGNKDLIGKVVSTKITGIASDRMVYGKLYSLSFKESI